MKAGKNHSFSFTSLVTDWSLLVMSDEEEIVEITIEKPTAKAKVKVPSLV